MTRRRPDFDRIARAYRWLEYITLGHALETCRLHFLSRLAGQTEALVLGDGDGRFLAHLLQQNPMLRADAVDTSSRMLDLLRERCLRTSRDTAVRLRTHHTDALSFLAHPTGVQYDLVVTHFFLDCLTQLELDRLISIVAAYLAPDALWLISDFRIPTGKMRLPATILVRSLYFAFRMLTGLRVTCLPDHAASLRNAGFILQADRTFLFGILTTEVWHWKQNPYAAAAA